MSEEILSSVVEIGITAFKERGKSKIARREAEAVAAQGELQAKNKAKEVARHAARERVSFLSSGLGLAGTPEAALASLFNSGIEDIKLIQQNANTKSKNIIESSRASTINSLSDTFSGAGLPDFGSIFGGQDSKPQYGPYQPQTGQLPWLT